VLVESVIEIDSDSLTTVTETETLLGPDGPSVSGSSISVVPLSVTCGGMLGSAVFVGPGPVVVRG
jgi:hypothetical protein